MRLVLDPARRPGLGATIFRFTPRLAANAFRNAVLRLFGAKIGVRVRIAPTTRIMFPWNLSIGNDVIVGPGVILYSLGEILIGNDVMISQGAHLYAGDHNWHEPNLPLLTPDIVVEPEVWIGAEAFSGGGARIARGSVCGARAVVFGSTLPGSILVGNPARPARTR